MPNNIGELQAFLDKADIPKIKTKPKTFLGIAKQPHYENVLSNLYAFYFDVNEEHGLKDLFIESLTQLINETELGRTKTLDLNNQIYVETEASTIEGGRIDILLSNENHAIIIENKVYHILNNKLEDYWNSAPINTERNKIGIVLSLNAINDTGHHQFINITHHDFLKRIMINLHDYKAEACHKYLIFMEDLHQNIENLSLSNMDANHLNFYFENQEKIIDIWKLNSNVHEHLLREVEVALEQFEEEIWLDGKRNDRLRFYRSEHNPHLMMTVVIEDLMTPKREMYIAVELQNDCLEDKERYRSLFKEDQDDFKYMRPDFYSDSKTKWAHFAGKHYKPDVEELKNFHQYIITKIKEDGFLEIFNRLDKYLTKEKELLELHA